MEAIFVLFISSIFVNNIVLTYFLGICPFLGVSKSIDSAFSMGVAVTFVMTITAAVSWIIFNLLLKPFGLEVLQYVMFIIVVSSLVQFVEMVVRKISTPLYKSLGIFLPLITTNCAILGLALFGVIREYSFIENVFFGLFSGIGFTLTIVLMAGIREQLARSDVPPALKGAGISLIAAGIMAMAFTGFSGII